MKSVLYLGSGAPWLDGAGYLVRQRMFLRALAEVARLELALFDLPDGAMEGRPEYARKVTPLSLPTRHPAGRLSRLAADFLSPLPRMISGTECGEARRQFQTLRPEEFDAVFSFRIDFAHFAGALGHPRLLLDVDDPEHRRWRRRMETVGEGGDWRTRRDLLKLEHFEKSAAAGARAAFVCHERDGAAFHPAPRIVPNCVDVPPERLPRAAAHKRVMMLGNFTARESPNTDGLIWFLEQIWPTVLRASPDAEFQAVGPVGERARQAIGQSAGATPAGFVPDLGRAFAEASLSVAPIRYGTGTRIKILESFARGCPVVSTSIGREGIEAEEGHDLLVGDNAAHFAQLCSGLLNDPAEQQRLGEAGRHVAATRYSEAARRPELAALLGSLLKQCQVPKRNVAA